MKTPFVTKIVSHAPCLVALLIVVLLPGCSSNAPNAGLVGSVLVQLSWSGAASLDLGATTPNGFVAANYFESDADPNCTHEGDDQGIGTGGHNERFTCTGIESGDSWVIVIDNFSGSNVGYTLSAVEASGGATLNGYPQMRTITAGDNQVDIMGGGERHSIGF